MAPGLHTARGTALAVAIGLQFSGASVLAAGFALQENSASGLGTAYAGGAAGAEDASTIWSNAAGMARLGKGQIVGALNLVQPSLKFSNANSLPALNQPLGGEGGNAGSLNLVPNLYVTLPVNKQWTLGLGVNAPFGLVSEYDDGWIGRFQAIKSDIKTINVNPAVAWKPTDNFAIGVGANYQKLDGTFTSRVNYSAALLNAAAQAGYAPGSATFNAIAAATPGLESSAVIKGSDYAWGWNVGILFEIDSASRIGAQYRSAMKYTLDGDASFTNPALPTVPPPLGPLLAGLAGAVNAGALYNSSVTSEIKLPEIVNVSYFRTLDARWDIMVDVQYTGWSSIQALTFVRGNGTVLQSTTENFSDAWRFSVGANYRYDERWLFRGGVAYDQSPVQDADRTPRLPDADRTWLALGTQYKPTPALALDFGAAYIWVRSSNINAISPSAASVSQYGLINGTYHNNVVVVSGQVTYSF